MVQSNVYGTVEGFVANRLSVTPNTAGSIYANWLGDSGRITYQGAVVKNARTNTISWDAKGNITFTQGV